MTLADRILEQGDIQHRFCSWFGLRATMAEPGRGMGFLCPEQCGHHRGLSAAGLRFKSRILICDFDVHHGNGTQEIFYDSDRVSGRFSAPERTSFPFSGKVGELGRDQRRRLQYQRAGLSPVRRSGIHLPVGTNWSNAVVEQFMPQIILVSAGYDGHADDPISKTLLSTGWFGRATHMFKQFARDVCDNRLLFILEGGTIRSPWKRGSWATLDSLLDPKMHRIGIVAAERAQRILIDHPAHSFWSW